MEENQFIIKASNLSNAALDKKQKLETDPLSRTNHMEYMEGMEIIASDIQDKVIHQMQEYDYNKYTSADVLRACRAGCG